MKYSKFRGYTSESGRRSCRSTTTIGEPNQCSFSNVDPVDKWLIFSNFMGMCPKVTVDPVDPPTTTGETNQCSFSSVDHVDEWLIFSNFMNMCLKVGVDSVDKW